MVEARASARRGRGRTREQRSRRASPAVVAGVRREIPPYALLRDEGLELIEARTDQLLKEVGVEFRGDERALELWREAGADVNGPRVRFDPGHVRAIIAASAPRSFTQHARNPERSVLIGENNVVFAPAYGMPFVRDLDRGRRYGSLEDFENLIKLTYSTPWLHHSGGTVCEPVDLPVNKRHLDMVYAHLRWTDKPFMGSVTAPERAVDSVQMARIVFGADFVDEHCVVMGNINMNSPLVYDQAMSGSLRAYAAANQCPVVVPFVLGGATAPGDDGRGHHPGAGRGPGGSGAGAAGAARFPGRVRELPDFRRSSLRVAHVRDPGARSGVVRGRPAGPARRPAHPVQRRVHQLEGARRPSHAGDRQLAQHRGAVRGELRAAGGRLARGRVDHQLREADAPTRTIWGPCTRS